MYAVALRGFCGTWTKKNIHERTKADGREGGMENEGVEMSLKEKNNEERTRVA